MPNPPLHLLRSITFSDITLGGSATAVGGGVFTIPIRGKNVVARIDGDPDGVFTIVELQVLGLVHEPDAPRAGRSWETVDEVDGTGPIAIPKGRLPGALAVTVSFSVGLSETKTAYAASVSIIAAGTTGPILYSIPISANILLIPPGISGVVQWGLDVFYPFPLPASEWGSVLQITANIVSPGPPGGFDSYTPVASGTVTSHTNDFTNVYVAYTIADAPYDEPLVIEAVPGAVFKAEDPPWTGGAGSEQTAGPNPVFLTEAQPGVSGVDFQIFGLKIN